MLYGNSCIITDFLKRNPEHFTSDELDIIARFKTHVRGDYILINSTRDRALLLALDGDPAKAYAVLGLTDALIDVSPYGIGTYFTEVVLLPWKDEIIWDGLCSIKPVILGRNYLRSFTETYKEIERAGKVINHF